jgi:hypothetical protein
MKCDCHRHYADEKGVELCRDNNHSKGKNTWNNNFVNAVEFEITAVCAQCTAPLISKLRRIDDKFEVNVMPHICSIEEPEE